MEKQLKSISVILTLVMVLFVSSTVSIYASETPVDPSEIDGIEEYTPDDWYHVEYQEPQIAPFAINNGGVEVKRKSSTKLEYNYTAAFSPKADTVTVKVWKCIYSSSDGRWITQGAAKVNTYYNTTLLRKAGGFTVTSGKNYKIKVYILQKSGSSSSSKTFWSRAA